MRAATAKGFCWRQTGRRATSGTGCWVSPRAPLLPLKAAEGCRRRALLSRVVRAAAGDRGARRAASGAGCGEPACRLPRAEGLQRAAGSVGPRALLRRVVSAEGCGREPEARGHEVRSGAGCQRPGAYQQGQREASAARGRSWLQRGDGAEPGAEGQEKAGSREPAAEGQEQGSGRRGKEPARNRGGLAVSLRKAGRAPISGGTERVPYLFLPPVPFAPSREVLYHGPPVVGQGSAATRFPPRG